MDYLSNAFLLFGSLSLIESGFVLYTYQLNCDSWAEALFPQWVRRAMTMRLSWKSCCNFSKSGRGKKKSEEMVNDGDKDYQLRRQLYHQIFYAIDCDFNGTLQLEEIDEFGYFISGNKWNMEQARQYMYEIDLNWDGVLDYEEFAFFCEESLLKKYKGDTNTLKQMIKGFLVILEKKFEARRLMWKYRARQIDQFCRYAIPPGFGFFLLLISTISEEKLEEIQLDVSSQTALIMSGLFPIMFITGAYAVFMFGRQFVVDKGKEVQSRLFKHNSSNHPDPMGAAASGKSDKSPKTPAIQDVENGSRWPAKENPMDDYDDGYAPAASDYAVAASDGYGAQRAPQRNIQQFSTSPSPRPMGQGQQGLTQRFVTAPPRDPGGARKHAAF